MLRSSVIGIGLAITVLAFQVGGCSSSNGGSGGKGGSGGSSSPGAGGNTSPGSGGNSAGGNSAGGNSAGGNSAGGNSAGGTGGASAGGTGGASAGGTGGASAGGTGGASAGGTGGASAGGTGGASAGGAGGGTAGTGGAGGSGFGLPSCAASVMKNGACTATDQQLCYKTCGPGNLGRKSETCGPGADGGMTYAEMSGCSYDPAGTYSCYKIPTAANAACPAGATAGTFAIPMGSATCTVADACTICNDMGGVAGGMYMDSSGMKQGFCVCVSGKWTCASNTAWPCGGTPTANNPGCQ